MKSFTGDLIGIEAGQVPSFTFRSLHARKLRASDREHSGRWWRE